MTDDERSEEEGAGMAPEATSQRSAASMSYANYGSGGAGADRAERFQITREAQRAVAGPAVVAFYAKLNPAINPARSHLNIDMVNDGSGSFRRTRSIGEVTAYGDERVERLRPGLKDGNRHMITVVGHLPWAYCEPDGTEYQVLDKAGQPRFLPGGAPMMQPRYKVKAGCEGVAERYFQDWIAYQEGLIPGGQRAIHGYSIQFDEGRPHIQLQADPYEPNPSKKNPDALKNGYSRVYGSHPKDSMVPVLDNAGDPVVIDGKTKMVREGPSRKMERYQAEHRAYMVERGYEVDPERDAERHDRTLTLADYKDVQHQRTEIQVQQADLGAALADVEDSRVDLAAELSAVEAETMAEYGTARAEGYSAGMRLGVSDGRSQLQDDLDTAEAARAAAEADRGLATTERSAAEQARRLAEAHAAALEDERQRVQADLGAALADVESGRLDVAAVVDQIEAEYTDRLRDVTEREGEAYKAERDISAEWEKIDQFDPEAARDGMNRWVVQAMRQDKTTFDGGNAFDHYAAQAKALHQRQKGLGRDVKLNETEGQRRKQAAVDIDRSSDQVQGVNQENKKQQEEKVDTRYQ